MPRLTTVTLPDGTVARRRSATRFYGYAVQVTVNLHERAARLQREADAAETTWQRIKAIVDSGDLTRFERKVTSVNGYGEELRSSFLPGDKRDTCGYWLPDYATASWGQYGADALKRIEQQPATLRALAADLLAGPSHGYGIVRWSERRDSAVKAAPTFVRYPEERAQVVTCQEG